MSETLILKEFKKNLIDFIDELIDFYPSEGDLIILRIFLHDQHDILETMKSFIFHLNKDDQNIKIYIKDRNDTALLEECNDYIDKTKLFRLKRLWRSSDNHKQTIWKWIDSIVYLSDIYVKNKSSKEI